MYYIISGVDQRINIWLRRIPAGGQFLGQGCVWISGILMWLNCLGADCGRLSHDQIKGVAFFHIAVLVSAVELRVQRNGEWGGCGFHRVMISTALIPLSPRQIHAASQRTGGHRRGIASRLFRR